MAPPLVLGAGAVGGTALLATVDPHTHHVPLCPIHALTGVWCPLCGGLRAVHDITANHWAAAFADNVVVLVLLPLVLVWWSAWLSRAHAGLHGAPSPLSRVATGHRRLLTISAVVLIVAYTVVRNLPVGAFLAPTG